MATDANAEKTKSRDEVQTMWAEAVKAGKVFKVEKLSKVRVVAVRVNSDNAYVPTKENRAPGQPVLPGDWILRLLDDKDDLVPAMDGTEPIYLWLDPTGASLPFSPALEHVLTKLPLADTWINRAADFATNYEVSLHELQTGIGIARANAVVNLAMRLDEEITIETSWGAPATGSHWLVLYKFDPVTQLPTEYDFNIVDSQYAGRAYRLPEGD